MSKLNNDIFSIIIEELPRDSKTLFSCLMVNRYWCKIAIPILWRNPWCYDSINYRNKNSLFIIIFHYLIDDIKEFITNQRIKLPSDSKQSLLFDYLSFCRSINANTINSIFSIGSSLSYNQFFMQNKFYEFFMKKCPELEYLDMRSIQHRILIFPEAKVLLESLCELKCDTSINSSYFKKLSPFCQYIQRLIIVNTYSKPNYGIVMLIEAQKNLKHFEWKDDFHDDFLTENPYEEVFYALEKKADSLNYLRIYFQYVGGIDNTLLQEILPKLYKLKILIIDDYLFFGEVQLEKLKLQVYNELEVLSINSNRLNVISSIIENSGRRLKKILFKSYDITNREYYNSFDESSLNFIRKIYENCPSIEYLSVAFSPSKEHFTEFEKLLKNCQNLKSLLIIINNIVTTNKTNEKFLENGKILLEILIKSAPTNLKEIRFYDDFEFSLENLEDFLEKWKGRPAISIHTSDSIYEEENYEKLINKYKGDGIIKDFKHSYNIDEIHYQQI